jgi:hypothetical protein
VLDGGCPLDRFHPVESTMSRPSRPPG